MTEVGGGRVSVVRGVLDYEELVELVREVVGVEDDVAGRAEG
jgi:hypothetical protein